MARRSVEHRSSRHVWTVVCPPPIVLAQHDHALLFSVRKDNSGPQTPEGVAEVFTEARLYFPNARIVSESHDRFVASVLDNATVLASLPMVTAEIGDTWIWGTVSDPLKTARFRSFERLRSKYLINGTCSTGSDPRLRNATRFLLKIPEHTWGLSGAGDSDHWSNEAFRKVLHTVSVSNSAASYAEQRAFVVHALDALEDHPLAAEVSASWAAVFPTEPSESPPLPHGVQLDPTAVHLCNNMWTVQFNTDGSLATLRDRSRNDWAPPAQVSARFPFFFSSPGGVGPGGLVWSTYDYNAMNTCYPGGNFCGKGWGNGSTAKAANVRGDFPFQMQGTGELGGDECTFLFKSAIESPVASTLYGAPTSAWAKVTLWDGAKGECPLPTSSTPGTQGGWLCQLGSHLVWKELDTIARGWDVFVPNSDHRRRLDAETRDVGLGRRRRFGGIAAPARRVWWCCCWAGGKRQWMGVG
eukprot:m.148635 g.148635  ORF g.148635 m.148635 type:complete len:469 (-) comp14217_c0_seq2:475-1881(-)